jgi:predicted nucleic acid-binding protein
MTVADLTFVDTNVLVYAHDTSESTKQPVARRWLDALWAERSGVVSTQVLQEFYVVATRKFGPPFSRLEARELVALYARWTVVQVDVEMVLDASDLEDRHQLWFWDALIVEAAKRAGATRLLTEDLQDGVRFGDMLVIDPFGPASPSG